MKKILPLFLFFIFLIEPIASNAQGPFKDLHVHGSLSLNYRNLSPKKPGYEGQVQHELYLTDTYFSLDGKINKQFPYILEFQVPTALQGQLNLYRFAVEFYDENHWKAVLGKQLVPFGYYNELYRGDQFLTVTRPLLYASPDSLDLVSRLNSPHPPFSAGYTDIGARVSYYPKSDFRLIPSEITAYVVNGFGEINNRSRTFPYTGNLNVVPPANSGVDRDWGHVNNNLADNNNNKAPGLRFAYALGDLKIPCPINEGLELRGVRVGFSGMQGLYDLEEAIGGEGYRIVGTDFEFKSGNFSVNGEYIYSEETFRKSQADKNGNVDFNQDTGKLPSQKEINKGYYVQLSVPIWNKPRWGEKVLGILAINQLERSGPRLIYSTNGDSISKLPVEAFPFNGENIHTEITKYTAALNYRLNKNFIIKGEGSYWKIKVPPVFNSNQKSVWQYGLSFVFSF